METVSPADDVIEGWIAKYGTIYQFHHAFGRFEELYYYRPLTRREYRLVLFIEDLAEREDEIVKLCILWPKSGEINMEAPAGVVSVLTSEILKSSGCADLKQTFAELAPFINQDLEAQMESLIEHVFGGGGNFERYKNWTHKQLYEAFYRAQWVLQSKQGSNGVPTIQLAGKEVDLSKLNDKQRQQAMAQARIEQRRANQAGQQSEPPAKFRANTQEGDIDLGSAIDDYAGGSPGLSPMTEFAQRHRKFKAMQQIRKHS